MLSQPKLREAIRNVFVEIIHTCHSAQMLMPKKNRIAIYELLFKEGVMVAKKDVHLAKHPELADKNVPNLHVMKAMQVRD